MMRYKLDAINAEILRLESLLCGDSNRSNKSWIYSSINTNDPDTISEAAVVTLIDQTSGCLYASDFRLILTQCVSRGFVSRRSTSATVALKSSKLSPTSPYFDASSISVFFGTIISVEEQKLLGLEVGWMDSTSVSIAIAFPGIKKYTYIPLRSNVSGSTFNMDAWNEFMEQAFN
jgi:hypothetical protein